MPDPRSATKVITDWLQNRLLGAILTDIGDLKRAHRSLEERVSALGDYVRDFRAQADAQTTRIGNELADLKNRLDQGDAAAVAEVSAALSGHIDTLRAMGTGTQEDPLPTPQGDAAEGDAAGGAV